MASDKTRRKNTQEVNFSRDTFRTLASYAGASRKEVVALFDEDMDDPTYDIKLKYPELAHIDTTAARLTDTKHMFTPVRKMPNKIWDKFLESCTLAKEYGEEKSALIFRVKLTRWVMTSEAIAVPQLTPVVLITTASGLGDIRMMSLDQYISIRY